MMNFVFSGLPSRVIFGAGSLAQLAEEVDRLGASRVLVLSTPGQRALADRVAAVLGQRCVGIHAGAVMHVPLACAEAARDEAQRLAADLCVAIGGGSTVGLAKAVALFAGIPAVAVPTTYAGSEMTPIYGITEARRKRTGRDPKVQPVSVIYDPELSVALPPAVSAASGVNAMAHAVEALYAADANPVISLMAEESLRSLAGALPRIVAQPDDAEARHAALYGAWLAGTCLGAVGMALHHKLCHVVGGTFNLPHAEVHAVLLPQVAHFNHSVRPDALARVAGALGATGAEAAGPALFRLVDGLGLPTSLRALGLAQDQLDEAVAVASQSPYDNPRPADAAALAELLEAAYAGRSPERPAPSAS